MKPHLVIAQHNESLVWVEDVRDRFQSVLVMPSTEQTNLGREAYKYLLAMEKLLALDGKVNAVFTQGDPWSHTTRERFLRWTEAPFEWLCDDQRMTDGRGYPWCRPYDVPVAACARAIGVPPPAEYWSFAAGAIFRVDTVGNHWRIQHWKAFIEANPCGEKQLSECNQMERGPWAMERLWELFFLH